MSRYDDYQSDEMKAMGMEYVDQETLFRESDIISLHVPLLPTTHHIINRHRYPESLCSMPNQIAQVLDSSLLL